MVTVMLSALPLAACACTGLCSALLQAVTQIQEQTISYSVKALTLLAVLMLGSEYAAGILCDFSVRVIEAIGVIDK